MVLRFWVVNTAFIPFTRCRFVDSSLEIENVQPQTRVKQNKHYCNVEYMYACSTSTRFCSFFFVTLLFLFVVVVVVQISDLQQDGDCTVTIVTGDSVQTACHVAAEVGLIDDGFTPTLVAVSDDNEPGSPESSRNATPSAKRPAERRKSVKGGKPAKSKKISAETTKSSKGTKGTKDSQDTKDSRGKVGSDPAKGRAKKRRVRAKEKKGKGEGKATNAAGKRAAPSEGEVKAKVKVSPSKAATSRLATERWRQTVANTTTGRGGPTKGPLLLTVTSTEHGVRTHVGCNTAEPSDEIFCALEQRVVVCRASSFRRRFACACFRLSNLRMAFIRLRLVFSLVYHVAMCLCTILPVMVFVSVYPDVTNILALCCYVPRAP